MGYDRYDTPRGGRERGSGDRDERERGHHGSNERGFFERAGEEISSWFGGDDERGSREHRPDRDFRGQRGHGSERDEWMSDRSQRTGRFDHDRDRDEDRSYRPTEWSSSQSDYRGQNRDFGSQSGDRGGYRPMAGDYGRSGDSFRGGRGRDEDYERAGRSNWDRDEYRRTSFAGSSERSSHDDPHYHECRQRHMDEFDRDYDEYRRESRSNFDNEFGSWRERRQSKREMLGQIREHMEVVGSDERHVGTVDRVAGDRIILTKSDPEAGGVHHSLSCTEIDRIEGERVFLERSAEKAMERWRDESRERALFEREDQGEAGPHMLDRSFSGTYR